MTTKKRGKRMVENKPASLMTKGEVARVAGVTPVTIRAWADAGLLPVERTSSGIRLFRRDDVLRFLRERGVRAAAR
jgi:excisionase family DNA binding protein